MSQQIPVSTPNMQNDFNNTQGKPFTGKTSGGEPYARRLFVHTGFKYIEVANSFGFTVDHASVSANALGYKYLLYYKYLKALQDSELSQGQSGQFIRESVGKFIADYAPPTPIYKTAEMQISNGPSKFHEKGKSSYKVQITILFKDVDAFNTFKLHSSNKLKYYDERGSVYIGHIMDSPEIKKYPAEQAYVVGFSFVGVKKSNDEVNYRLQFTDVVGDNPVYTVDFKSGYSGTGENVKIESIPKGLVYYPSWLVSDVLLQALNFATEMNNSEFGTYYTFSANGTKVAIVPKSESYVSNDPDEDIVITPYNTGIEVDVIFSRTGEHWAKDDIQECAEAGLITTTDISGNTVYIFRPNANATRGEFASLLNRLRKYVEKVVRE